MYKRNIFFNLHRIKIIIIFLLQVYNYLYALEERYPELVSVEEIGRSYEDRPIYALKISRNNGEILNTKPIIIADGTLHAR